MPGYFQCSSKQNCSEETEICINIEKLQERKFEGKSDLKRVHMTNNVISIGNYAFTHCRNLESVTLSNKLTSIGISAFAHCGLTEITFIKCRIFGGLLIF